MAIPKTYSAYRRTVGDLPLTIELSTETVPETLEEQDVLMKIHAVSLNFRDVGMLVGRYPFPTDERGIVASDCAAEVVAIGSGVKNFKIGDHVAPTFDMNHLTGHEDNVPLVGLGGNGPGVLSEYAIFDAKYLVHLPEYLSWEEASTLACAGVTAWTSLSCPAAVARSDASALLEGTGGVSVMAVLICLAAGIKPIITSSSDEKLASIKKLGSVGGINYKTTPDIAAEARRLTDGKGVDFIINNTGVASIPENISSLRSKAGTISLVGFLKGFTADWNPSILMNLLNKRAKLQGIGVGSKVEFEQFNRFLEEKKISFTPVIDRVFSFQDSKAAFEHLLEAKHVGKVVIKL